MTSFETRAVIGPDKTLIVRLPPEIAEGEVIVTITWRDEREYARAALTQAGILMTDFSALTPPLDDQPPLTDEARMHLTASDDPTGEQMVDAGRGAK